MFEAFRKPTTPQGKISAATALCATTKPDLLKKTLFVWTRSVHYQLADAGTAAPSSSRNPRSRTTSTSSAACRRTRQPGGTCGSLCRST